MHGLKILWDEFCFGYALYMLCTMDVNSKWEITSGQYLHVISTCHFYMSSLHLSATTSASYVPLAVLISTIFYGYIDPHSRKLSRAWGTDTTAFTTASNPHIYLASLLHISIYIYDWLWISDRFSSSSWEGPYPYTRRALTPMFLFFSSRTFFLCLGICLHLERTKRGHPAFKTFIRESSNMTSLANLTPEELSNLPALDPPPGVVPNFVSPENQNRPLLLVTPLELGITILFVLNRFYFKSFPVRTYSWDDCQLNLTKCSNLWLIRAKVTVLLAVVSTNTS